ncbi:integrase, catalytic region, zinc finger, CCHC-type containing protein [Tanacetum coccineum]
MEDPTLPIQKLVESKQRVKHSNDLLHLRNPTAQDMEILVKTCLMPLALKTQNDSFAFVHELKIVQQSPLQRQENIAISELKKLIEKCKGKSVDTKFDKPSVVRQPNAQRIPKPSVLGKPAPFSDSLERKKFAKKKSVLKTNESEGLSKPVTPQNLPQTATQAVRNTNVIKPGMYRIASSTTQTRAPQLNQTSRNTNPRGYLHTTGELTKTNVATIAETNQMKEKIVQLIIFIVDYGCTKHMTGNLSLLCNFVEKYLGTVRFGNDQFALILGYGDLVQGNITIKRVYYVEGLNHNLFSVGQFCDADLEVAFQKSTCFVRDLQGNDLLTGNRGTDLYTISLQETTSSTPICLMAKASPTQAWLWHRRLSHLNFDYINLLSKKDVVIGLPKLKYVKDQLCSSCEVSKAKRSSFKSKTVPSSKGRLNLLHMDLCGPMRVASINEKMNDPIAVANKQNCWTIDYKQLNALYNDFVPQKESFVEQTCSSSSYIPFVKILETKTMPSELPLINELFNIKVGFEKLFLLIKQNSKRASMFYTSKEEIALNDFCRDQVKPLLNELLDYFDGFQNLFQRDIKEMKDAFEQNDVYLDEIERQNDLLKDQLLEASLKHDIELCVLLNHECVDKSLHDELEQVKKKSLEIQEGLKARIKILEKDVQRCEKQSVDFELKLQHEKEKHKWDSSKNKNSKPLDFTWISRIQKLEDENVSLDFKVQSLIKERDNAKMEYKKLFDSIKKTRSQTQKEMDELISHVFDKTYAYGAIRSENQNLLDTISELKARMKNGENGMNATSSVKRPKSRDSHVKTSVLDVSKNEAKKEAVYVRKNKQTDNTFAKVVSNKENVIDVAVANASKAKTLLCVSCMQNVLIHCHDKCVAKHKLNVRSNARRTFSVNSRIPKSSETTFVAPKTRFSEKATQSKTLDTTSVASKSKIDEASASKARDKVSSAFKKKESNMRDKPLSPFMLNKIRTSRLWQKWFESQPNVMWTPVNTKPHAHTNPSNTKPLVVQIVLWVVDSGCSKHMTGDRSLLRNFVEKFMGTVRFGNDNFAAITGYGDYIHGNITICHVYYVEGLGHNLFSVGQFCDGDLEVAFRSNTCYVRNLEGDDLLTGGRDSNLYTISISDMAASSPICLMSKATSTKSWLWHRRLSHLNFGTINDLTKLDLVDGLPKFKYGKDHLCSACERGKSKKASHPPKLIPSDYSKLELLHMDLCGPMRVASVNGKKYILVIVDDFSRFTWVYFLRSKDETPEIIKKFIAQAQLNYKAKVCKIRTDNGTEFKNATLKAYYEKLGVEGEEVNRCLHESSVDTVVRGLNRFVQTSFDIEVRCLNCCEQTSFDIEVRGLICCNQTSSLLFIRLEFLEASCPVCDISLFSNQTLVLSFFRIEDVPALKLEVLAESRVCALS